MCDTVVVLGADRVFFAKNSDRDPNEGQYPEWIPARTHCAGTRLRCTWIEIPQVPETHAILISRPFWIWGAEMGANACGVVIGNEAVFTHEPYATTGLTGMDLVRLGLERGETARRACELILDLLAEHGQGGGCGYESRGLTYHNSFLIADRREAFVLETAGKKWAVEEVRGARSISNGLSIPEFAAIHADRLRTSIAGASTRRARTECAAANAGDTAAFFRLLRDHGTASGAPAYTWYNGGMRAPCMHAGGLLASAQTTASWVSELSEAGTRHWITATAAPCTSLFKPAAVDCPADIGPAPGPEADDSLWWRHERLHRAAARDPEWFAREIAPERDAIEAAWLAAPPEGSAPFRVHADRIGTWLARWPSGEARDSRPFWVRRAWRRHSRRARL